VIGESNIMGNVATCPLDGNTEVTHFARAHDIEYRTSDREFDFYHCQRCGVLFIDPMLTDRLREIYPTNYYSFAPKQRSLVQSVKQLLDRRSFAKVLAGIPGDRLSALDIGGGTGWLLDMIRAADPRCSDTWVVDFDPAARSAAEAAGHKYFTGRIEDFQSATRFDLILMLNVIEHVADPRAVLAKARELLKPGGRLIIKTPNFDALDARLFRHASWGGFHTPRHFVLFTKEGLTRLAAEVGFQIAEFSYTQGAPFWSVSVLDQLARLGLVSITPERPAIYHPLMPVLQVGFAAFDFARRPFGKLSQMHLVLTR
jgi:2-polyprenyl-3-methyl-5-hydroxy-6-metoxy-1,4-benzoquinol methylase